ncbi:hypothetical protein ACM6PT_52745, partial [Klebsiella pneumoniae]
PYENQVRHDPGASQFVANQFGIPTRQEYFTIRTEQLARHGVLLTNEPPEHEQTTPLNRLGRGLPWLET